MLVNQDRIRLLAAQQGMNLSQLAARAGVSRATMSAVVTRGSCRAETVLKLSDALGVTSDDIVSNAVITDRGQIEDALNSILAGRRYL